MTAKDWTALEVYDHLFASVAEEMGAALMRAAFSPNIKERRDFSCAVFDARGRTVAQAAHIPVHLGSAALSVQAVLAALTLGPGEVGIVNDPYAGGTHLPDITLVEPVYVPGRKAPVFYVANRAHHADVGGKTPGSMGLVRSVDDEGLRIRPSRLDASLRRAFAARARDPEERLGDLDAQVAANRVGVRRLVEIVSERGIEAIERHVGGLFAWARRRMEATLREWPRGRWRFEDVLDDDGLGHTDIAIRVALTLDGTRVRLDLRDSDAQVSGPLNAVRAVTVSAAYYVLRCLGPADLPGNDGWTDCVEILTRPGTVVDPREPAPVAAGNVETSQRIVDALLGAFAQALPERVPAASAGTMNNVLLGFSVGGVERAYYETLAGGAGAGPWGPGADAVHTHMTNTLNTPVEALEHAFPLRVERYAIRDGSGGAGRHRGGRGVVRTYRFLAPASVTLVGERRRHAPWGLCGGRPAAPGAQRQWRADAASWRALPGKCTVDVGRGDLVEVETPGGGGWGSPD